MEIPDDIADDEDKISDYLSEQAMCCHYGGTLIDKNDVKGGDLTGRYNFPMAQEDIIKKGKERIHRLTVWMIV